MKKSLKEYNEVYKNRNTATIAEVAEASAYFSNIGSQLSDRAKELKKILDEKTSEDLLTEAGESSIIIKIPDGTLFTLKDSTVSKVEINEKELLKLSDVLGPSFFENKKVVSKDAVVKAYEDGSLPVIAKPYVSVYKNTSLVLKKKPTKKVGDK